jgi:HK97 family phage major capsid protein/HK97 family phage prohead protease
VPIKVKPGESQSSFMSRCVPDLMGDGKREQDQAVAACLQIFRDKDKKSKATLARLRAFGGEKAEDLYDDVPDVEDGEELEEYIDRCLEDLGGRDDDLARDVCRAKFEEDDPESVQEGLRGIKHKLHSQTVQGMEFVLSDETPDRMGEVIMSSGWDLSAFKNNPICLFGHNPNFAIGKWHNLRVEGRSLRGNLELAPKGTSQRIDEIRSLIDAGILKAVSVGFRPLDSEPLDPKDRGMFAPQRYLKHELVECSVVAVPANRNALAVMKSLGISPATADLVLAKHGRQSQTRGRGFTTGKHASSSNGNGTKGTNTMPTLSQRIVDVETQLVDLKDKLAAHWQKVDDSNVSDTDLEASSTLNANIAQLEKTHAALIATEKNLAKTADGANGHVRMATTRALATVPAQNGHGHTAAEGEIQSPHVMRSARREADLLDYVVRAGAVAYAAKIRGQSFEEARQRLSSETAHYGDEATKLACDIVLRANSAPAMTTVTGWAAELVRPNYTDLLPQLMPKAILTRLAPRGLALNFGQGGRIIIPMRSRTPTIAGSFVGEGQPIPVRQGAFTSQTLTPKKMAVITTFTREMQDHSTPAIEPILREAIQVDTTVAIDSVLIDANPATTVRPAGLLNGVSVTPATSGGGIPALVGDIKNLIGSISTATYGNLRNLVWLMNPTDVLSAGLVTAANTGIFPFLDEVRRGTLNNIPIIDSAVVPVKTMILLDAADFVVVGGEAPRIDASDQATLHMDDTAPLELVGTGSPGVVAAPQRSLFQTDSIAIRMIMPLNWTQRRPGTVAWTQTVTW